MLRSSTPSTDGRGAFQDPSHVAFYNENSFWYLTQAARRASIPDLRARLQVGYVGTLFPSDFFRKANIPFVEANLLASRTVRRWWTPALLRGAAMRRTPRCMDRRLQTPRRQRTTSAGTPSASRQSTPAYRRRERNRRIDLIATGLDVVFVSRQLGHANPTVTLGTYAHQFGQADHAVAARAALEATYWSIANHQTALRQLEAGFSCGNRLALVTTKREARRPPVFIPVRFCWAPTSWRASRCSPPSSHSVQS